MCDHVFCRYQQLYIVNDGSRYVVVGKTRSACVLETLERVEFVTCRSLMYKLCLVYVIGEGGVGGSYPTCCFFYVGVS